VACDWENESKLPAVCSTRQFVLENHLTEEIVEEVFAKVEEIKTNIKDEKKRLYNCNCQILSH